MGNGLDEQLDLFQNYKGLDGWSLQVRSEIVVIVGYLFVPNWFRFISEDFDGKFI